VVLTTDNGGGADDVWAGAVFDDQAAPAPDAPPGTPAPHVRNVTYTDFTVVGPLQPEGALGAFFGDHAGGPWALVVTDDGGGSLGMLNGWSLTLTTLSGVPPADAPAVFAAATPQDLPNGDAAGLDVPITVSGLTGPVLDVDVTVEVRHGRATDIDLFLTSPSGRRIELVTDFGEERDDLYAGTTFDDDAPDPVSDTVLPDDGTPVSAVVPEGALGAFLGEPANGDWILTAADDSGGEPGRLESWTLRLLVPAKCGNGTIDPGEQCDDGNGGNGDGCDEDCQPSACGNGLVGLDEECDDGNAIEDDGCTSTCRLPESICDDCLDNDGDGRTDLADSNCGSEPASLKRVKITKKGALVIRGRVAPFGPGPGAVRLIVSDAEGHAVCATLPDAVLADAGAVSTGDVGGGTATVTFSTRAPGKFTVQGAGIDFSALTARQTLSVGLMLGSRRWAGARGGAKSRKR
jgi:cysteine-rich repeat protein